MNTVSAPSRLRKGEAYAEIARALSEELPIFGKFSDTAFGTVVEDDDEYEEEEEYEDDEEDEDDEEEEEGDGEEEEEHELELQAEDDIARQLSKLKLTKSTEAKEYDIYKLEFVEVLGRGANGWLEVRFDTDERQLVAVKNPNPNVPESQEHLNEELELLM